MERVYINVGGEIFETYLDTIMQLPYFQGKLNLESKIDSSRENPIFIDRDPKIFRHILNFLRDHNYEIPKKHYSELDYWGLEVTDLQSTNTQIIKRESQESQASQASQELQDDKSDSEMYEHFKNF